MRRFGPGTFRRSLRGLREPYRGILWPVPDLIKDQGESPKYTSPRQIAKLAYVVGLTKVERMRLYSLCDEIGLKKNIASALIDLHSNQ